MPSASRHDHHVPGLGSSMPYIIKFTNCFLASPTSPTSTLTPQDLWIDVSTGLILDAQRAFYHAKQVPNEIIDLHGAILAPGFVELQVNGGVGFDFSVWPSGPNAEEEYKNGVERVSQELVRYGVTSYLPTIITQHPAHYHRALPRLGPNPLAPPGWGAEVLGAHCEGPFLQSRKNGCHDISLLRTLTPSSSDDDEPTVQDAMKSMEECYGQTNMHCIKLLTAAPELPGILTLIPHLVSRGITFSIGHTSASLSVAREAVRRGARMVTHLFNAMGVMHQRDPGVVGLLGDPISIHPPPLPSMKGAKPEPESQRNGEGEYEDKGIADGNEDRLFYGLITDSIHVSPSCITIAHRSHPTGTILTTDAMALLGLPDGTHSWTGASITKHGKKLTLTNVRGKDGEEVIAGSAVSMDECLRNFVGWTGCGVVKGIKTVTAHPARAIGVHDRKGSLEPGMEADLVVLSPWIEEDDGMGLGLEVLQTWRRGVKVFDREWEREEVGNGRVGVGSGIVVHGDGHGHGDSE